MSVYIYRNLSSQLRLCTSFTPINKLFNFNYHHFTSSALINSSDKDSFTVSYLVNSCGLGQEHALSASKRFNLRTPETANSVIAFFKKHGFTDTQISKIVRRLPSVLSSDCENTILPKLEYFTSKGFSSTDLINFVATSPYVLKRSLVNSIIPTWNFLESLVQTNERQIILARRYFSYGWSRNTEAQVMANIKILRELGVTESSILSLLTTYTAALRNGGDRFSMAVEKAKQIGCNPHKIQFVVAVHVMLSISKSTWEKKVKILKKWGWSEDDVYVAFRKFPLCMAVSEDKMSSIMDMVVNKSGFDPSDIVQSPGSLLFSFEKRVVPRCLFYQVLLKRGLIRKKWSLNVLFGLTETKFIRKITVLYKEGAPELLKLYQEKLGNISNRGLEV